MYEVLVPVDQSEERALAQARYVAGLPDAAERVDASLLFVFSGEAGADLPDELRGVSSVTRVASVRRARELLEEAGVAVTVLEDSGDAAADIVRDAEERGVDAIVLGGRKRSPAGKALFGSVTQEVILNTDLPVVVTGGGGTE